MATPTDPRDQPPPLPAASPRGPRGRLPPFLARYCPDSETVKQRFRLWSAKCLAFLRHWLTRFGNACAPNWTALDRTGRLLVACLGVVSLCCALLAIAGWSRKPGDDARSVAGSSPNSYPKPEWKPDHADRDKGDGKRRATAEVASVSVAPQREDPDDEHMTRGSEALRKSDWDLAILEFTAAVQQNPRNARAYSLRGEAYYWNRNAHAAIADCTTAIALNPREVRAYVVRGAIYANQERFAQAMASFDEAVRITPSDASLYAARGAIYANQERFAQAMVSFDEAIRLAPNDAALLCCRARCALAWVTQLWHEGRGWQAAKGSDPEIDRLLHRGLDDTKKALQLAPTSIRAKGLDVELKQGLIAGQPSGGGGRWAYPYCEYRLEDPLVVPRH